MPNDEIHVNRIFQALEGRAELAEPVKIAAAVRGLVFSQQRPSVLAMLEGIGLDHKTAVELAAGLEEAVGLGREA